MLKKALILFVTLLAFANAANAQNNLNAYQSKIELYRYSKYLDSTKIYFKKALPIVLKKKDSLAIFRLYKHLGDAYEHHQFIDSTLLMYDICNNYIPAKNYSLKSFLLNDKAYSLNLLHDYEGATKLTLQALKFAEKSGDKNQIASVTITLAEAYSRLEMNQQADKYYLDAIKLSNNPQYLGIFHQALRFYAIHLIKNKKIDLAYKNLNKANKIASKIKDSISMAYNWHYLADCYWNKKQIDSCFIVAKKAEKIWERRAENIDLSMVCMQQGEFYLALNQFEKAAFYLKKAEKYMLTDLYFNEQLFSNFADLYNKNGNSKLAFSYLLKAKKTIEQIKENENKSQVSSLNIKFESDKKEILLKEEKQLSELANLKASKKTFQLKIVVLITVLLLLTLSIILYSFFQIKKKNKLLNDSNVSLENLVNQKKTLLKEIHHRVKNNLTTLKSLLFLQAKATSNIEVKSVLKKCQLRIQSMAFIHQSLYEDAEQEEVNFYLFLEQLMNSIELSYKSDNQNIVVNIEKNDVALDISIAIFLGLILNELVTNSYKYAFANRQSGAINIKLQQNENDFTVVYSDNGCGLPNGFNEKDGGFGFKIIRILVQQIKANLVYEYQNNLSTFTITINNVK